MNTIRWGLSVDEECEYCHKAVWSDEFYDEEQNISFCSVQCQHKFYVAQAMGEEDYVSKEDLEEL